MPKKELVDLFMILHHKTEKAVLVSDDGDEKKAVWLPLSQVEVVKMEGNGVEIACPVWLAINKGLI